jgi:DNA-binding NarL/FixJ family response regulator
MTAARLMIVDDHTLFREGLRAIFKTAPDIEIVGEAGDGNTAVQMALELRPEIILMDIQMAHPNGIEACKRILEAQPATAVIMLTMLEDAESLFAAMAAGAKGYVLKGADKAEVLKTIRAVAEGEVLFGPAIANRMTDFFRSVGSAPHIIRPQAVPFPELTEREREILEFIAQGLSNADIAERLKIAPKTISNHVSNIFNKLQVADRVQAVIMARKAGMGQTTGRAPEERTGGA